MAIFDPRLAVNPRSVPPLQPFPVESFGGLDLRRDPQEVGWTGAIDSQNIEHDKRGRVRSRDGSVTKFTATAGTPTAIRVIHPHYREGTTGQILLSTEGTTSRVVALDSSFSSLTTVTPSGSPRSMATLATPTATRTYIAGATETLYYWDGSAFTGPVASTPVALYVGVSPKDNRLVCGYIESGGSTYRSRVQFSDPGDPATWGANNYVDLTPGRNGVITALATWREVLIVFKDRAFFVFYGTSTDATGEPIFEYTPIEAGVGCIGNRGGVAVAPEGVYFVAHDGIYFTTGEAPRCVSRALDPWFAGVMPSYSSLTGVTISTANRTRLAYVNRRLYATFLTSAAQAQQTFVYDPELDAWSPWTLNAQAVAGWSSADGGPEVVLFGNAAKLEQVSSSATDDAGAAFTAKYRTGFADLGTPLTEKIMREVLMDGIGSPTVKVAVNDGSLDSGTAVTLGTSPATGTGRHRRSYRGRNFSLELSASSAFTVNRAVAHVMGERPPGVKSA